MQSIKFKSDYGYPPAAPAFFVWHEDKCSPSYRSRAEAEAEAAFIAVRYPGDDVLVLGAVAAISTSKEVVGQRFNPDRTPEPEPIPEFAEVEPPAEPQPAAEEEQPL